MHRCFSLSVHFVRSCISSSSIILCSLCIRLMHGPFLFSFIFGCCCHMNIHKDVNRNTIFMLIIKYINLYRIIAFCHFNIHIRHIASDENARQQRNKERSKRKLRRRREKNKIKQVTGEHTMMMKTMQNKMEKSKHKRQHILMYTITYSLFSQSEWKFSYSICQQTRKNCICLKFHSLAIAFHAELSNGITF